jgi:mannosyltransferase OCH1-like enzyme
MIPMNVDIISEGPPYHYHIHDPEKPAMISAFQHFCREHIQTIPKIIHQIWIGPNPPPWEWINTFRRDFTSQHPDWEYHLWRDEAIQKLEFTNKQLYAQEEQWSAKADILRYELLYKYGGIYIDADSRWLNQKPLNDLIQCTNQTAVFAGREDDRLVAAGVIGASPHNLIMDYTIQLIKATYHETRINRKWPAWVSIGPVLFTEAVKGFGITVYPTHYFYPRSWLNDNRGVDVGQFPDSYMMQYGYTTNNMGIT